MTDEGRKWISGLRQFIADCRARRPILQRDELSTEQEMQCRIIGASLIDWLERHGPRFLQERSVLAAYADWEKDPLIAFTSTAPGLVAAREILEGGPQTIAFLHPEEISEWRERNPDRKFRWHIET